MILLGVLVFAGKVLGCSGQTNRVELARRDGHHKSHRRTADTAGLSGTTGGQQKNGSDVAPRFTSARRRSLATRRRVSASKVPRTTGGARSGTRTTTARRILMMSAATRTGESNPRTSRDTLTPRAHSFSSSSLLLPPASHMVTKTESTH